MDPYKVLIEVMKTESFTRAKKIYILRSLL